MIETLGTEVTPDAIHRTLQRIVAALAAEPLEDGIDHACEEVLAEALSGEDAQWPLALLERAGTPAVAAAILVCLGRLEAPSSEQARATLLLEALGHESLEVRDAAIQAAELWQDRRLLPVLSRHQEATPWLSEYLHDVVRELLSCREPETTC